MKGSFRKAKAITAAMKKQNARFQLCLGLLLLLLAAAVLAGCMFGNVHYSAEEAWQALFYAEGPAAKIVRPLRLPRVLGALLVGGILPVCGCALQGLFRNPMADTGVLGVSGGAGLGATAAIVLGLGAGALGSAAVTVCAFIGGILAAALVYSLALVKGRVSTTALLLSGVCVSSLTSALQSLLMLWDRTKLESVFGFLMGSFSSVSYKELLWAAPIILFCFGALLLLAKPLDMLLLGSEHARSLGVPVGAIRACVLLFCALGCAAAVSFSGVIAFVGLMIPHLLRMFAGPSHRRLMLLSFPAGGIFLILTDLLCRTLISGYELPIGVFTSLVGAPFFLFLLKRKGVE